MDESLTPESTQGEPESLHDSLEGAQLENEIPDNFSQTEEIQNNPEVISDVADPTNEDGNNLEDRGG